MGVSFDELAKAYAARLSEAASPLAKAERTKVAAAKSGFAKIAKEILTDLAGRRYESTNRPLSHDDELEIFRAIDRALGIRPGSFEMLKKGSLQGLIQYDQAVQALLDEMLKDDE